MALDLAFESFGSGEPLVVLHGLFGSGRNWRTIARALSDHHTVYTVDLRNHGGSRWADAMDYGVMADDVLAFFDEHGLQQPALMGHSMGGKAAMALALMHTDRVKSLVVVDIAPIVYSDRMNAFAEAMRTPQVLAAATRTEVQRRLEPLLPDPSVAPFLMQNLVMSNDHYDWRINLAAISSHMQDIADFPPALRDRRFDRPLTVISGETSTYVPHHDTSSFTPMFPRARVEVIAGAGHWVHADQPRAFVDAARRALQD